jgi:predicted 3-demethylubiquinone-9 3-methyltransferase (glyoxalase superfamily)
MTSTFMETDMTYISGLVTPVPRQQGHLVQSAKAWPLFREFGAIQHVEEKGGIGHSLREHDQPETGEFAMAKELRNCLWFDGTAEEAARFYAETFPGSSVDAVRRAPSDFPGGRKGDLLTVEFTLLGRPFLGLNGGSHFKPNEAVSFMVITEDQEETDRYWNAIVGNGGQESACGWCKDRWGFSWQITPRQVMEAMAHSDPAVAERAMQAMLTMRKIDIAKIEAAAGEAGD